MTTGLVIFSRMSSKRLPGKALCSIQGRPLLGHVLDRTRQVHGDIRTVIATSKSIKDDAIAAFAMEESVDLFRGYLDDVLQRAIDCASTYGFARIARVCGDRPFLDPTLIERLIATHIEGDLDLATNAIGQTFPPGLTTEIVATRALKRVAEKTRSQSDHEHVTKYIYEHPDQFRIYNLESDELSMGQTNLAVDTPADLERAKWIAARLDPPASASRTEIVSLAYAWLGHRAATTTTVD